MHSGTLMSRRIILLKCEEIFDQSGRNGCEAKQDSKDTGIIKYKKTAEWQQAYKELKSAHAWTSLTSALNVCLSFRHEYRCYKQVCFVSMHKREVFSFDFSDVE